ncbi:rhodanese-like domain-containing protein [Aspergillus lucknowensis]|uniref:Rhodanese-like domain-containing protein n=1 Tax=Aspergillus lucknowensis TaxID=176173 RepID=A0ABR4M3B4_9EURO
MASVTFIRPHTGDVASFLSRTIRYTLAGEYPAAQSLWATRRFGTTCLASQTAHCQRQRTTWLRSLPAQRCTPVSRVSFRWNSEKSDTPTFRQWVFEDINALLPSANPSTPPSTPQKNLILVDVREPAELSSTGVIPSAVAVPLASQPDALFLTPDEFETRFGYPKPGVEADGATKDGTDIVFYCKAGVRARAAAQLAVQAGYDADRIGVYDGSWLDWAQNGGRVEKWEGDE